MTTEIGDAGDKYRDKVSEEDDLGLTYENLIDIVNGKPVIKRIPIKSNPQITYGYDDGGEGDGMGNNPGGVGEPGIDIGVKRGDVLKVEKNWGINFTKPGKKDRVKLEFMVAERGYQENQEETLEAMLQRQILSGEFKKHGFKVDVKEEDLRYDNVEEKYIPDQSAHFIIIRDISPSMQQSVDLAYTVSLYIAIGLQEMYQDKVTMVYGLHGVDAQEVSQEDFFKEDSNGNGTMFASSYKMVSAMLDGTPYDTRLLYPRKIDHTAEDVYVLHITDAESNAPATDIPEVLSELETLLPKLTKVMLLQVGGNDETYKRSLDDLHDKRVKTVYVENEMSEKNVKKAVRALFGN